MNKFFASIGAVTIGAAAVQAAGLNTVDPAKPWSVSATLRGFYDDNYTTAPKNAVERDTFGISVSPSISLDLPLTEQTSLGFRYTFGAYWYQDRADQNAANDPWDYSHQFDAFFNHEFSERYKLDARDSFVISQEPALLNDLATPYRTEGDNLRNVAEVNFTAGLTPTLSTVLGYQNTLVDYENSGGTTNTAPSLSGLLDRTEHLFLVNLRWLARQDTTAVIGYNYGEVNYSSSEVIGQAGVSTNATYVTSSYRDSRSHFIYGGVDHTLSKEVTVALRGGVQILEYVNDPLAGDKTSPYGQLSVNYTYLPGSKATIGWTLSHRPTDVIAYDPATGRITQDQFASVLFANINHRFNALWTGFVNGFWQASEFNGGFYDGSGDDFFGFGLGLRYRFNQYLSGEVGYSFDTLVSDLPNRDYDRNRVYMGVTATY